MNNLGGMVFLVVGIALGYWVLTGRSQSFLQAVGKPPPGIPPPGGNPPSNPTFIQSPGTSVTMPWQTMFSYAPQVPQNTAGSLYGLG